MKKWAVAWMVLVLGTTAALAGSKWTTVGTLTAGGSAKEVGVNRSIETVQIECTDGTVIVNTVVIREGAAKTPITVAQRFNAGDKRDLAVGGKRNVTGLRISDGGRGSYTIRVK